MCAHAHAALAFASADIPVVTKLTEVDHDPAHDVISTHVAAKEYVLAHLDDMFLRTSFSVGDTRRIKCSMCK